MFCSFVLSLLLPSLFHLHFHTKKYDSNTLLLLSPINKSLSMSKDACMCTGENYYYWEICYFLHFSPSHENWHKTWKRLPVWTVTRVIFFFIIIINVTNINQINFICNDRKKKYVSVKIVNTDFCTWDVY